MSIDSVEALEALAPGTTIRVTGSRAGTRDFIRTEGGFTHDGVELEPKWFAGHVKAGEVRDWSTMDPEAGDHFTSGQQHHYLILSVGEQVRLARCNRRGRFVEASTVPLVDVRAYRWNKVPTGDLPAWHEAVLHMASNYVAVQDQLAEVRQALTTSDQERREALLDAAHRKANRAAQVHVVVDGTTRLPNEKAAGEVPKGVTVTAVAAVWKREFTVTTEPAAGCQCGAVTRAKVAEELGLDDSSEFRFSADCGRH